MTEKIKMPLLVDKSEFKVWLPSEELKPGANVLIETPHSQKQKFDILIEVVRKEDDQQYVGRVIGPEPPTWATGTEFLRDADLGEGLKSGDLIYFKKCNVR
jgi:hypothetical protein